METIIIIIASILTVGIFLIGIVLFGIRKELISEINQLFTTEKIKKILWASMTGVTKEEIKYEHITPRMESILILLRILRRNESILGELDTKEPLIIVNSYHIHSINNLAKRHKTIQNNIISLFEPRRLEGLNKTIHFEPDAIIGIIEELIKK